MPGRLSSSVVVLGFIFICRRCHRRSPGREPRLVGTPPASSPGSPSRGSTDRVPPTLPCPLDAVAGASAGIRWPGSRVRCRRNETNDRGNRKSGIPESYEFDSCCCLGVNDMYSSMVYCCVEEFTTSTFGSVTYIYGIQKYQELRIDFYFE